MYKTGFSYNCVYIHQFYNYLLTYYIMTVHGYVFINLLTGPLQDLRGIIQGHYGKSGPLLKQWPQNFNMFLSFFTHRSHRFLNRQRWIF